MCCKKPQQLVHTDYQQCHVAQESTTLIPHDHTCEDEEQLLFTVLLRGPHFYKAYKGGSKIL